MAFDRLLGSLRFLLLVSYVSSSSVISDSVFESHQSTGRALLQTLKSCPVDFENENYTIITSQCKGPKYPADACCSSFKEFACPHAVEINDMSTDCATTMFSYINLYGKYPPGLFANQCKEGKQGLDCRNVKSVSKNAISSPGKSSAYHVLSSPAMTLLCSSVMTLLLLCLI